MLFPNGISHYLIGGLLIGLAVAYMFLISGKRVGASSFFTTTLSFISKFKYFNKKEFLKDRDWRVVFSVGLILGAALYATFYSEWWTTDVQWWRLLIGGFLVGVGTRLGRGCTSGHGVCGVAAGSKTSITSVIIFVGVAILTAFIVSSLGVTP